MNNTPNGVFRFPRGSALFLVASFAGPLPASADDQHWPCPNAVVASGVLTGPAPAGWTGSGEAGPYGFKQAKVVNQGQLACVYVQKASMAGLSRPWAEGATCTFAGDKKSWNCIDATGTSMSYPCPASLMISSRATGKVPEGWQGSGESAPFPFLNAPAPDTRSRALRCVYQVPEFGFSLTRVKPAGPCSFDTARMSWACKSQSPAIATPAGPGLPSRRPPGQ